jgi:NAD(P)-dependent dehydrogenase (short-subunit alcohol dehydrogenase family)
MTPPGVKATMTEDGLESTWGLNYIANFHLLSILSPALRAQPPDRDVRIIFGTCSAYMGGRLPDFEPKTKKGGKMESDQTGSAPTSVYATSKLALMTFAVAFQKHLSTYARPDKKPMNARVIMVDPGWTRTPGMRRFLTFGSLWGLALYLFMWPFWWLVLKSGDQGAQTFLYAAMEAQWGRGEGNYFLKECRRINWTRKEIEDEALQQKLWESSSKTIELLEKESAKRRASEKKEKEKVEAKSTAKEAKTGAKQRKAT